MQVVLMMISCQNHHNKHFFFYDERLLKKMQFHEWIAYVRDSFFFLELNQLKNGL